MGRSIMVSLPLEIHLDILNRVPVKSICRLRSVCKLLLQVIDSPEFKSIHSRSLILTNNTFAEEPPLITLFNSLIRDPGTALRFNTSAEIFSRPDPSSDVLSLCKTWSRYKLWFSFYNFIFVKDMCKGGDCFLLDPFREEGLRLPNSDIIHQTMFDKYGLDIDSFGMGFDYINNTYKIIRISRRKKGRSYTNVVLIHVLGTSSWREIPQPFFPFSIDEYGVEIRKICAYGDMHWIFNEGNGKCRLIRSFDFTKEEFYFTPYPPTSSFSNDYYITLKGCMAVIGIVVDPGSTSLDLVHNSIDVWVMKDYTTKEWTLVYHLSLPEEIRRQDMFDNTMNCGEWDYGVFFVSKGNGFFFFDLRNSHTEDQAKYVEIEGRKDFWHNRHAFNCRRTFISLKEFENSVQDSKAAGMTNHHTFLDFSKKYL